jgi:hypothetical protein
MASVSPRSMAKVFFSLLDMYFFSKWGLLFDEGGVSLSE